LNRPCARSLVRSSSCNTDKPSLHAILFLQTYLEPESRPAGSVCRLRPRHPPRLRLRPSPRGGRRGHGRCPYLHRRGHEDPFQGHPSRQGVRVDDHERRRAARAGLLHRGRRGVRRGPSQAHRHDPERHPEGVHGAQHLHLPARGLDAHHPEHLLLHQRLHAQVQQHLHQWLPHPGGRRGLQAGARLHHRRRHRVRESRPGCGPRRGQGRSPSVLFLRHR